MNRLVIATLIATAALGCAPAAVAVAREPYPPARLWYRVSVDFSGAVRITDDRNGQLVDFEEDWTLESRHAVRLTLLCVNVKAEFGKPFEWKERIRGQRRRVGGCPRPTRSAPRANLRETVRFAATADGGLTRWDHDSPIDFIAGCPGRVEHYQLVERQPVTGQISSASSATDGLRLLVDAVAPLATYTTSAPAIQCITPAGVSYERPAITMTGLPFLATNVFGDEGYVGGALASEQLALRFPPRRFGRDHVVTRRLSQGEDLSRTRVLPPAGPYFQDPFAAKTYTYTIRFEACPRGGRAVSRC